MSFNQKLNLRQVFSGVDKFMSKYFEMPKTVGSGKEDQYFRGKNAAIAAQAFDALLRSYPQWASSNNNQYQAAPGTIGGVNMTLTDYLRPEGNPMSMMRLQNRMNLEGLQNINDWLSGIITDEELRRNAVSMQQAGKWGNVSSSPGVSGATLIGLQGGWV